MGGPVKSQLKLAEILAGKMKGLWGEEGGVGGVGGGGVLPFHTVGTSGHSNGKTMMFSCLAYLRNTHMHSHVKTHWQTHTHTQTGVV